MLIKNLYQGCCNSIFNYGSAPANTDTHTQPGARAMAYGSFQRKTEACMLLFACLAMA